MHYIWTCTFMVNRLLQYYLAVINSFIAAMQSLLLFDQLYLFVKFYFWLMHVSSVSAWCVSVGSAAEPVHGRCRRRVETIPCAGSFSSSAACFCSDKRNIGCSLSWVFSFVIRIRILTQCCHCSHFLFISESLLCRIEVKFSWRCCILLIHVVLFNIIKRVLDQYWTTKLYSTGQVPDHEALQSWASTGPLSSTVLDQYRTTKLYSTGPVPDHQALQYWTSTEPPSYIVLDGGGWMIFHFSIVRVHFLIEFHCTFSISYKILFILHLLLL